MTNFTVITPTMSDIEALCNKFNELRGLNNIDDKNHWYLVHNPYDMELSKFQIKAFRGGENNQTITVLDLENKKDGYQWMLEICNDYADVQPWVNKFNEMRGLEEGEKSSWVFCPNDNEGDAEIICITNSQPKTIFFAHSRKECFNFMTNIINKSRKILTQLAENDFTIEVANITTKVSL